MAFLLKMEVVDLHDMWFQQDGATCEVDEHFGEDFISRLDYFLWGYGKAHIYIYHIFIL